MDTIKPQPSGSIKRKINSFALMDVGYNASWRENVSLMALRNTLVLDNKSGEATVSVLF